MIARWNSQCSLCNGLVKAGTDVHYDGEAKTTQHWPCYENPKPGPEAFRLAEELGFIPYDQDMAVDGLLRRMLPRLRSVAAGRVEPQARRGSNPTLFSEE